ncbi:MAG: hypothetical protein ACXVP7_03930 [Actinomycetota bacterium]
MKALPRAQTGRSAGTIATPDHASARAPARRLALRLAFVASAACGVVLSAGAAAHADPLDSTPVSTTVATATDAIGSTVDTATTATDTADPSAAVSQTVDALTDAATSAVDQTESAVDDAGSTLAGAVGDASNTITKTVTDTVTNGVTAPVEDLPTEPVDGVVHTPIATTSPALAPNRIVVRTGSVDGGSNLGITAAIAVRVRLLREGGATRFAASSASDPTAVDVAFGRPAPIGHAAADVPPAGASPIPTPAWPPAAASTGLAIALIGAIVVRTASGPPRGWRRIASPTTPFFGAAIALAVERPG